MTGRRSSAVELALRLVRDGASPSLAAKIAGCHVRSVKRALGAQASIEPAHATRSGGTDLPVS
jgi:hypothetical protein